MADPKQEKTEDTDEKDSGKTPESVNPIIDSSRPTDISSTPNLDTSENKSLDDLPPPTRPEINFISGSNNDDVVTEGDKNSKILSNVPKPKRPRTDGIVAGFKRVVKRFDVYIIVFIFLVILAITGVFFGIERNKTPTTKNNSNTPLNQSALSELNNNDTNVGGTGQVLTVQPNSVFNGSVLVKGNLQIAGTVQLASSLVLPGITVTGTTKLGDVNASSLSVSGSETLGGQLIVQQGLNVGGAATFGSPISAPQLTVSTLQVNGNIIISHHLVTTGSIPKITTDNSVGSAGTTSVNGNDTAGQVDINTGSNPSNGCLATITFSAAYSTPPNVVLTEVETGSSAPPAINYYIVRSASSFSICSQNTPANQSFGFDYTVID